MTTSKGRHIEMLGQEQRRRWSVEEARTSLEPGPGVSVVARRNGINPNQLLHWRKRYQDGSLPARGRPAKLVSESLGVSRGSTPTAPESMESDTASDRLHQSNRY